MSVLSVVSCCPSYSTVRTIASDAARRRDHRRRRAPPAIRRRICAPAGGRLDPARHGTPAPHAASPHARSMAGSPLRRELVRWYGTCSPSIMHISFLGATGTVTGSKYVVPSGSRRIMVDGGLFQGLKEL